MVGNAGEAGEARQDIPDAAELRAQARRARSLASGLVSGSDQQRLHALAESLEEEAAGRGPAPAPDHPSGRDSGPAPAE